MPAHNPLTKMSNFTMLRDSMRRFALLTALWLAGAGAPAQTATNLTANTAANPSRRISLVEAVKMALESNLDIQVTRFNPQLSQFDLAAAYAAYEPTLNFSGRRIMDQSPGGFDRNIQFAPQIT